MAIKKIKENIYEIDKEKGMNVPVVVYASEKLLNDMKKDRCLEQAKNVAHLQGIEEKSVVLMDSHQGYGFPIGGVAAFDLEKGVISPGGIFSPNPGWLIIANRFNPFLCTSMSTCFVTIWLFDFLTALTIIV